MPYASDRQRRYMHTVHPDIAARWDDEIKAKRKRRGWKQAATNRRPRIATGPRYASQQEDIGKMSE